MSKVSICNAALIDLGADTIMTLTQDSESARACNAVFDTLLDQILTAHNWNCAKHKQALAQSATAPLFGYEYAYALPTDPYCLKVLNLYEEDSGYEWKVVGRYLETSSETANIEYLKRVTDINDLTPTMAAALSALIAATIAYRITANASMRETMWKVYGGKLQDAIAKDAQEKREDLDDSDSWIDARA